MNYYFIQVETSDKFKYVRYLSGKEGYNNMAEVTFYSKEESKPLTGKVIGTEGYSGIDSSLTKYALFDNNPLTYYNAKEANGSWAGIEFDSLHSIGMIKFLFRNDDNNIRIRDEYELFYWGNNCQWISVDKKVADDISLIFENVPSNGLYLLHNHTRGKEEQIFTYEKGEQIWW